MDDGKGGDFISMIGLDSFNLKLSFTTEDNLTKGSYYRFMYRAQNSVGWGDYSNVSFILAAQPPDAPPAPEFVSSTSATVSLRLSQTLNDGGDPVTAYKLFRDAGDDFASAFT